MMSDIFSAKKRSEIMAAVKSKNSKAEILTFSFLRRNNIYFQKHYRRAPGTPDIAIPAKKRAVFIDGDFWHGKDYKKLSANKKLNAYWDNKIQLNIDRDIKTRRSLKEKGWDVLVIWESDLSRKSTQGTTLEKIKVFLTT